MALPCVLQLRLPIRLLTVSALAVALAGCQPFGASRGGIMSAQRVANTAAAATRQDAQIRVVEVSSQTVRALRPPRVWPAFKDVLEVARPIGTVVGVGDTLEVNIWESPPATLFGQAITATRIGTPIETARPTTLPELPVGPDGSISVPFAGVVPAAGRTLREIEANIVQRLRGRANQPQVLIRLLRNTTATVTVVGEVNQSARLPLTPRGERLLDAIAAAGGVKAPVNLTTVQLTRAGRNHRMLLSDVIEQPGNNVVLAPDDVVTALFQPYSFTVLGAAGRNDEVRFEAMGITLAQALGRMAGLQDGRADPRGVFLFRWEARADGTREPMIYDFDMKNPETFFLAQRFMIEDNDLVYVTNSPVAELQRFVGIISSTILPVATLNNVVR